jgi:hypothetical protein
MSEQPEIQEARALLEEFERRCLTVESVQLFSEAVDILIDIRPSKDARWLPPELERLLTSYSRSLLSKMEGMDRKNDDLVIAVLKIINFRIYPAIVLAVANQPRLAKSYDDLLLAWPSFSLLVAPVIGPETKRSLANFDRR